VELVARSGDRVVARRIVWLDARRMRTLMMQAPPRGTIVVHLTARDMSGNSSHRAIAL
jgi:hypothetical protein